MRSYKLAALFSPLAAVLAFVLLFYMDQGLLLAFASALIAFGVVFAIFKPQYTVPKHREIKIDCSDLPQKDEVQALIKDATGNLAIIRGFTAQADDYKVRVKIKKLTELGDKIFEQCSKDPAKITSIRRFFTYYLDTAAKLCQTYVQVQRGASATDLETARKIAGGFDLMLEAFQGQLGRLTEKEKLDIDTEMKVLENILHSEKRA
ncbi:MAG: 5-bromo-4-chloroindolyl phosphate hydrolysis family protein [Oscillospiraceae bacterium]